MLIKADTVHCLSGLLIRKTSMLAADFNMSNLSQGFLKYQIQLSQIGYVTNTKAKYRLIISLLANTTNPKDLFPMPVCL